MTLPAQLNASILPLTAVTQGEILAQSPDLLAPPRSIGLCLSGGGSRALTCALGQLRALDHLGLMDQIFAISSVSGGTWANSLYTYLPASISDADFLGTPVLDPAKLTVTGSLPFALDQLPPNNLGWVPTRLGVFSDVGEILRLKAEWGYSNDDLWQGLIGHSVLRDYGLWQPDPQTHFDPHWFSWTPAYLQAGNGTLARNPGLGLGDFYSVSRKRPFMVFNTSIFINDSTSSDLVPFEANFMLGVRQPFPAPGSSATIGGGLVASMGMNGAFEKDLGNHTVSVSTAKRAFTLADIVGCSSAAFAQAFEESVPLLNGIVPRYRYFPIVNRTSVPTRTYRFADGGSLENLGVNALLARGLSRLLVGVNTDEKLQMIGNDIVVSSDIPPLFGLHYVAGKGYVKYSEDPGSGATRLFRHNRVFHESDFPALQQALWQRRQHGEPVVVKQTLSVLPNPWFGVAGGGTVEVLWMYNDFVDAFWQQLDWEVRGAIDVAGELAFPLYNTFTQLKLDAVAVNALAHLWCWNLAADWTPPAGGQSNRALTLSMFQ
ncbi:MAG: hypothetical protein KDI37_11815 [Xanthomonadales bacterium]|nr:hypothetical protein [Xanthomonadales bacterium]